MWYHLGPGLPHAPTVACGPPGCCCCISMGHPPSASGTVVSFQLRSTHCQKNGPEKRKTLNSPNACSAPKQHEHDKHEERHRPPKNARHPHLTQGRFYIAGRHQASASGAVVGFQLPAQHRLREFITPRFAERGERTVRRSAPPAVGKQPAFNEVASILLLSDQSEIGNVYTHPNPFHGAR